jgi:hypothetical protein
MWQSATSIVRFYKIITEYRSQQMNMLIPLFFISNFAATERFLVAVVIPTFQREKIESFLLHPNYENHYRL